MRLTNALFILFTALLLTAALPSAGQKKSPAKNVKEKSQPAKDDPWADYQEEKDSVSRWEVGINVGSYFPNKYSANFYNGCDYNVNKVSYIFDNKWFREEIYHALKDPSDLIFDKTDSYNFNMHYQVAITAGVYMRYNFNRKNSIYIQANYVQLKASSVVVADYVTYKDSLIQFPILGKEERAILDIGYQRSFPTKSKVYFFLNGGAMMCYTHVRKSVLVVEGKEYSLINVYDNIGYPYGQELNVTQQGLGFGGLLGGGVGLPVTDKFTLEPGLNMQYFPVNLSGYPGYRPCFTLYLRILLGFSGKKTT